VGSWNEPNSYTEHGLQNVRDGAIIPNQTYAWRLAGFNKQSSPQLGTSNSTPSHYSSNVKLTRYRCRLYAINFWFVFHVGERVWLVDHCCLISRGLLGCWPPTLTMEADRPSETHVNFKQNTRRHIPEDCSSAPNEACNFRNVHNAKVCYNFPPNHKICGANILATKGVFHSALQLRSKQSLLLQIFIDAILRIPQTDACRSSCNVVLLIPKCAETDGRTDGRSDFNRESTKM
jgi:hypothetical protein